MSKINLINDNCFNYFPQISDKSIDMILCDLPYGTTKNSWDSQIDLQKLWSEYERIIKDNGAILLFAQSPFDKFLGCSNLKLFRYEWIWQKTNATGHLNANRMPMKAHENILVFYKKLPKYYPQMTHGHERKISKIEHRLGCNKSDNYGAYNFVGYDSTDRYPRDVITFASDKQIECLHPTQKPVALLEYLIKTYTDKGDIVLDNCMGSGSTAIACLDLDRNFIGIEINEEYYQIASSRLNQHFKLHCNNYLKKIETALKNKSEQSFEKIYSDLFRKASQIVITHPQELLESPKEYKDFLIRCFNYFRTEKIFADAINLLHGKRY